MVLQGKGFYIWQIRRCEAGNASAIANVASQAGLSHVLIKVADGTDAYNVDAVTGVDLVPPVVRALRERGILIYGWQYVYGYEPLAEADIAIQRIRTLGLDGFTVDAEAPYKQPGRDEDARIYMGRLRKALPNFPIALSSYRFPSYHPTFPFQAFLEYCDTNMPQVYWLEAHNPGEQLTRSLREFQGITPFRPLIPTGSAFKQGSWQPSPQEIIEFMQTAQNLNMTAANFWEWGHTRTYLPDIWQVIADYPWPPDYSSQDIVARYIAALNEHNPDNVLSLYNANAVHVTGERTIQGLQSLRTWFTSFFNQILPQAVFTLISSTGSLGSRHFTWKATSSVGNVDNGNDTFGLVNNKIMYHYTYFKVK